MKLRCFQMIGSLVLLAAYCANGHAFLAKPYLPDGSITWTYREGVTTFTTTNVNDDLWFGGNTIGLVFWVNGDDGIYLENPPTSLGGGASVFTPSFKLSNANIILGETVFSSGKTNDALRSGAISWTYTATSRPVGFETVTTPLGTFYALRFDHTFDGSVTFADRMATVTRASNSWFVSGIGLVKHEVSVNGAAPTVAVLIETNIAAGSPDTQPDPLTFNRVNKPLLNSEAVSNAVAITGINVGATSNITGGSYSINGSAFTSEPGVVNNGDTVRVRVTPSGAPGATACATLTVGVETGQFCATDLPIGLILSILTILLED